MAEEAALRVRLYAEDVPLPVAQGREVERGPARVPRVSGVLPTIVDESEHDLIVVDEFFQNPLLAVLREHEDVVVVQVASQLRRHVSGQLLEVDLLRVSAEMPEVGDGLVLAVRALDVDDCDPDVRALHETTA